MQTPDPHAAKSGKRPSSRRPKTGPNPSEAPARPMPVARPHIIVPDELPSRYVLQVAGDCLSPHILDGAKLEFSRDEPFKPGDLVGLFFRPEKLIPGQWQVMVKRLVLAPPGWVTFPWNDNPRSEVRPLVIVEQLNPPRQFGIACGDLLAIHRCLGPIDPARVRNDLSDIEQRQVAKAKGRSK